ncbi:serine hydrolase [Flavihumibacter petaseus]|uniref:Peptidase S12 family protein n=1 Tax=Flavihumibacter petaseus NBRC 106054 TaxID=1220578 RepID=A0A0E9N3X2_9BACT|nr:serine hydrolase [Flavihumibacter petaseus]GAO44483.1 hypothetical protein FPE01S_03_05200 [Flavihumibacter petaseus NBRC 106054]
MYKYLLYCCSLLAGSHSMAQLTNPDRKFRQVDQYFDSLMRQWHIPGLAVGIVYADKLVYGKGFGVRDLSSRSPVDTATLFQIASNTKLFTAMLAAEMAQEKQLDLDAPVRNYYADLTFSTDELNAKASMRDLLSHRTGLPRYDALWIYRKSSRDSIVNWIPSMKPTLSLRQGYIYNNMMYAAAGLVMEKISNSSWEQLIRKNFFEPLEMNRSCFTESEWSAVANRATSYIEQDSTHTLFPITRYAQSEVLGPAGTIKSTVADMSHWMIALLNDGSYKGHSVISPAALRETLVPNAIADKAGRWEELSNALYGLGRTMQTYKGYKITSHTGSIDGFYSQLLFCPTEKTGIFIVFNLREAGSLRNVIGFPVLDILLGLSHTPWIARYKSELAVQQRTGRAEEAKYLAGRQPGTKPSHALSAYRGTYMHPVYGKMIVDTSGEHLTVQYWGMQLKLQHFHYDQFTLLQTESDLPELHLYFMTGENGEINAIQTELTGDPAKVQFEKQ